MTAYRRKLDGLARKLLPAPQPDFTGWTANEVLLWEAQNGGFEEIVEQANDGVRPAMVTPEEHEAELRAEGKWPVEAPAEPMAMADAEPAPEPGTPAPKPWWEERAQFRHRGPDDYDWADDKQAGYFCVGVDYDVFADAL